MIKITSKINGAFLVFALCLFPRALRGAQHTGTTAANFLKIPVAAVPAAMGNTYTAMIGPDSILYNPAGLGLLSYPTFSGTHNQYFAGIIQEYAAATYRTKLGTVGLAYSMLKSGDIKAYDLNENPIGETSTFHRFAILSFSQCFPHFNQDIGMADPMIINPGWTKVPPVEEYRPKAYRFSAGASLKYLSERLDDETSNSYSFDAGLMLVLPRRVQIGLSALNLTGDQTFYLDKAELPRIFRFGLAKDFRSKKNLMIFTLAADAVKESDYDFYQSLGFEMSVLNMFQLRFGYKTKKDEGPKLTGGLGMNFDKFTTKENFIKGLRVDYAYCGYGDLGATHRFGFQFIW